MGIGRTNAGGSGGVGVSQIIVKAETGSTVTCKKGSTTKTVQEKTGTWTFSGLSIGTWTVTASKGASASVSKDVSISQAGQVVIVELSYNVIPVFTYTGQYALLDDNDNPVTESVTGFKLKLLTSGTLTFTDLKGLSKLEVFLYGGGGGSGPDRGSPGSGGGYTKTVTIEVQENKAYEITVGAGGTQGNSGGSTLAFGQYAAGGEPAKVWGEPTISQGGNGGSGGNAYGNSSTVTDGNSGQMGYEDTAYAGLGQRQEPGPNGETGSTREFGDPDGKLYCTGGRGGYYESGNTGGYPRPANTGDGAYGTMHPSGEAETAGSGGVIIRNPRG